MATTVTSSQLESWPQPSSQPTSPALYSSFNQPPRTLSSNMYSARSQGSLPGTPTTSTYSGSILDVHPGTNYADFLRTWSDSHVSTWLTNIKCGHHSATFRASDIRGDVLLELDQVTLKEIGVVSVGDRLRILSAVKHLRQKCSNRGERASTYSALYQRAVVNTNEGGDLGHRRTGSDTSSRSAARRHEHGRPPPLQLGSSTNPQPNLPHIIRDNASTSDSFRLNPVRPLPHPVSVASSSSTPVVNTGSSQSSNSRAPHLPLPPVPRGHPPPPPAPSIRPTNRTLLGRKTPTQLEAPEFTSQPLPPAPTLLTPGPWSGYGLPPDPKAGMVSAKSPSRSQSPLPNVPPRISSRSPVSTPTHGRNLSSSGNQGSSTPPKPTQRPAGPAHPYAQGVQPSSQTVNVLSPIAESFSPQHTPIQASAPSSLSLPPTSFAVGRGPFANASLNTTPSLVDLRRKLVKFMLGDEGHSATINVEDCVGGVKVLEKVLKKFGKLSTTNTDAEGPDRVGTNDGGLSVDGWCVYLDWGNDASLGALSSTVNTFSR